jgi:hypothetical protein
MQYFCSEYKTEVLLKMGLDALEEIEEVFVPRVYALDPHKLMRSIEDLSLLEQSHRQSSERQSVGHGPWLENAVT